MEEQELIDMPWLRQPGESTQQYKAFTLYYLKEVRDWYELTRKSKLALATLKKWAAKFDWESRSIAWDNHLTLIVQAKIVAQAAQQADLWLDRQEALRELEYKYAMALMTKAQEMLDFPLTKQQIVREVPQGEKTIRQEITIEPTRWNMRDASRFFDIASRLGRLSSNMATEKTELDLTKLTDGEIAQLAGLDGAGAAKNEVGNNTI